MPLILIIDDEASIRNLLTKILNRAGYETICAADGKEGLKLQNQTPADLVITDLIMPEKDGIETIMELRKDFPDVKIIAMSGGGRIEPKTYLNIAKNLGATRSFKKPFDQKELLATIDLITNQGLTP